MNLLPHLPRSPHGDGYIVGLSRVGHLVEVGVNEAYSQHLSKVL